MKNKYLFRVVFFFSLISPIIIYIVSSVFTNEIDESIQHLVNNNLFFLGMLLTVFSIISPFILCCISTNMYTRFHKYENINFYRIEIIKFIMCIFWLSGIILSMYVIAYIYSPPYNLYYNEIGIQSFLQFVINMILLSIKTVMHFILYVTNRINYNRKCKKLK